MLKQQLRHSRSQGDSAATNSQQPVRSTATATSTTAPAPPEVPAPSGAPPIRTITPRARARTDKSSMNSSQCKASERATSNSSSSQLESTLPAEESTAKARGCGDTEERDLSSGAQMQRAAAAGIAYGYSETIDAVTKRLNASGMGAAADAVAEFAALWHPNTPHWSSFLPATSLGSSGLSPLQQTKEDSTAAPSPKRRRRGYSSRGRNASQQGSLSTTSRHAGVDDSFDMRASRIASEYGLRLV